MLLTLNYRTRHQRLMDALPDDSFVIRVGYQQKVRSNNIKYHFRQDNDFLYLTGLNEPDAVASLYSTQHKRLRYTLLLSTESSISRSELLCQGGVEGAISHYGADEAYDIAEIDAVNEPNLGHRSQRYN